LISCYLEKKKKEKKGASTITKTINISVQGIEREREREIVYARRRQSAVFIPGHFMSLTYRLIHSVISLSSSS